MTFEEMQQIIQDMLRVQRELQESQIKQSGEILDLKDSIREMRETSAADNAELRAIMSANHQEMRETTRELRETTQALAQAMSASFEASMAETRELRQMINHTHEVFLAEMRQMSQHSASVARRIASLVG
jgi:predicted  nucleic acid-binding Zn-ribbon protein